jgi:hypothetical protein
MTKPPVARVRFIRTIVETTTVTVSVNDVARELRLTSAVIDDAAFQLAGLRKLDSAEWQREGEPHVIPDPAQEDIEWETT